MNGQATPRSADELAKRVSESPELQEALKSNPTGTLWTLAQKVVKDIPLHPPLQWDYVIYRIVVVALSLVVLAVVAGVFALALQHHEAPQVLTAIGSTALGAVAGLLAPSPGGKPS